MRIKAVARTIPPDAAAAPEGVTWHTADLLASTSFDLALEPGDVVINLAYMSGGSAAENISLVDNIIQACLRRRVARLLHCSTAVVIGAARTARVTESTPCVPVTAYEQTKLTMEQHVLSARSNGLDVGMLRPTAIVGPGGQNLVKLAKSLQHSHRTVNYLRACLFGRRPMHLVPVRNVAAALLHLAVLPGGLNGEVYIVASDDDPENNFQNVEEGLMRALGLESRKFPILPVPRQLLSLLLRLRGRSETSMARCFESKKLLATNFRPIDSVAMAVRTFGESLRQHSSSILPRNEDGE